MTKISKLWVNYPYPPSGYFKPGNPFKNLNRGRVSNIIGLLRTTKAPLSSFQVANLLRLFDVPQVSYAATSAELSDK